MPQYQATAKNAVSFDLTKDGILIGSVNYKNAFKLSAVIETASSKTYQVEPKGFWGTTIELRDGEKIILKFKMNWSGEIIIESADKDPEKGYMFKQKGFFKETFTLSDQDGIELLALKPHLKWSKMSYEFELSTSDSFEKFPDKELLLLTSVLCANYYMAMASGG